MSISISSQKDLDILQNVLRIKLLTTQSVVWVLWNLPHHTDRPDESRRCNKLVEVPIVYSHQKSWTQTDREGDLCKFLYNYDPTHEYDSTSVITCRVDDLFWAEVVPEKDPIGMGYWYAYIVHPSTSRVVEFRVYKDRNGK